jgi:hypothetical protein
MITDVSDESDACIFTVPILEVEVPGAYKSLSIKRVTHPFIKGYNYLQNK